MVNEERSENVALLKHAPEPGKKIGRPREIRARGHRRHRTLRSYEHGYKAIV